jgi:hypothetical protein
MLKVYYYFYILLFNSIIIIYRIIYPFKSKRSNRSRDIENGVTSRDINHTPSLVEKGRQMPVYPHSDEQWTQGGTINLSIF